MSTIPNLGAAAGFVSAIESDGNLSSIGPLRRFTVAEFDRLAEAGILRPDERVELLEGIVTMTPPIGGPHSTSCDLIYRTILRMLPAGYDFSSGRDVELVDSVPVPDGLVLRGSIREYSVKRAVGDNVALVVEVADSTLARDRGLKQNIYAASGIPEYWIVNIPDRKLEVFRRPTSATDGESAKYEMVEVYAADRSVDVVLDGTRVGSLVVREILP